MLSINGSIRTCKVDTGYANRLQSDRFFNPNMQVCPVWNGTDTVGRPVCPDSFYTKSAGCNSAEDRVLVENYLRPDYSAYITFNPQGISGETDMNISDMQCAVANNREGFSQTGHFGGLPSIGNFQNGRSSCSHGKTAYATAMDQEQVRTQAVQNLSRQ